ncbi:PREDICTED: uncharacterized protein LOC106811991 [Priapulus caudatus]|uniref:Uncharacterized protein LOC106811991 n=1 Tax=Priapulus caudatus TaxID=37621 RepID=A0ABM1EG99_PRICU|nr:PREDICTED: uncharacterized protein LOC106811991 [Priapulus caudatus]
MFEQRAARQAVAASMQKACETFEANAWRKNLCAHCFRTRVEHAAPPMPSFGKNAVAKAAVAVATKKSRDAERSDAATNGFGREDDEASQTVSNGHPPPKSALVKSKNIKNARNARAVVISDIEAEVIGYGGDDHHGDSDAEFMSNLINSLADDDEAQLLSDDDHDFAKLTVINTEWNSENENLLVGTTPDDVKPPVAMDTRAGAGDDNDKRLSSGSDPNSLLAQILGQLSEDSKDIFSSGKPASSPSSPKQNGGSRPDPVANGDAAEREATATSSRRPAATTTTTTKTNSSAIDMKSKFFASTKATSTIFSSSSSRATAAAGGETKKVVVQSRTVAESSSPMLQKRETVAATTVASPSPTPKFTSGYRSTAEVGPVNATSKPDPVAPSQFRRPDWFRSMAGSAGSVVDSNKPLLRSYKQTPKASVKPIVREPAKPADAANEQNIKDSMKTDEEKSALVKRYQTPPPPLAINQTKVPPTTLTDQKKEEVYYFKYDAAKQSKINADAPIQSTRVNPVSTAPQGSVSSLQRPSVPPVPPPNAAKQGSPTKERPRAQTSFLHGGGRATASNVDSNPYSRVPSSIVSRPRQPSPPHSPPTKKDCTPPPPIPPHLSSSPEDENYEPIDDMENIYDAVDEKLMHSVAAAALAAVPPSGDFKKASSPVYAEPNLYDSIAPLLASTIEDAPASSSARLKPELVPPRVPRKNDGKSPEPPPKLPDGPPKKDGGSRDSLDRRSSASSEVERSPDLAKVRFATDTAVGEASSVKDKEYFDRQKMYRRSTGAIEVGKLPDLNRGAPGRHSENSRSMESSMINSLDLNKGKSQSPPPPPSSSASSDSLSGTPTSTPKAKSSSMSQFSRLKSPPSPSPHGDVAGGDEAMRGGDTLRKKKFSLRKLMKFGNKEDSYAIRDTAHKSIDRRKLDIVVIRNTEDGPQMIQHNSELEGATVESLDDIQRTLMATSPERVKTFSSSLTGYKGLSSGGGGVTIGTKPARPPQPHRLRSQSEDRSSVCMRDGAETLLTKDGASKPALPPPLPRQKPDLPKRGMRPVSKSEYMNIGEARLSVVNPTKPSRHPYTDTSDTDSVLSESFPAKSPPPPPTEYDDVGRRRSANLYDPVSDTVSTSSARSSGHDDEYLVPIGSGENSKSNSLDSSPRRTAESNVTVINISDMTRDMERLINQDTPTEAWNFTAPLACADDDESPSQDHNGGQPVPTPRRKRQSRGSSGFYEDVDTASAQGNNYTKMVMMNLETLVMASEKSKHKDLSKTGIGAIGSKLKWKDFLLKSESPLLTTKRYVFYSASWKYNPDQEYTLVLLPQMTSLMEKKESGLYVFAEFEDSVPSKLLQQSVKVPDDQTTRVLVAVTPPMMIESLCKFADNSRDRHSKDPHVYEKTVCFLLLQALGLLKNLQGAGSQEVEGNLDSFVLVKREGDSHQRLVFLDLDAPSSAADASSSSSSRLSLCACAARIAYHLLHVRLLVRDLRTWRLPTIAARSPFSRALGRVVEALSRERPAALTQAAGALEFALWGPEDRLMRDPRSHQEDDAGLRLWLELERARKVNCLARAAADGSGDAGLTSLGVLNEHHVHFLVRGTVKKLLESHGLLNLS